MSAKVDVSTCSVLVWCNEPGCAGYWRMTSDAFEGHRLAARHENVHHPEKRTANANLTKFVKRRNKSAA